MAWQYFAKNCEGLGLPNNGYPTTPDAVQCIRYEPAFRSFGPRYQFSQIIFYL